MDLVMTLRLSCVAILPNRDNCLVMVRSKRFWSLAVSRPFRALHKRFVLRIQHWTGVRRIIVGCRDTREFAVLSLAGTHRAIVNQVYSTRNQLRPLQPPIEWLKGAPVEFRTLQLDVELVNQVVHCRPAYPEQVSGLGDLPVRMG